MQGSLQTPQLAEYLFLVAKGSSHQQEAVAAVGSNFESLIYSSLFCLYLSTEQFEKRFPGDN